MKSDFKKAIENALRCMLLKNENESYKNELDLIERRKTQVKAYMASNAGEIHRVACENACAINLMNEEQLAVLNTVMEVVYDASWEELKLLIKSKCNCDGKPFGVKNCPGCDSCTCGD